MNEETHYRLLKVLEANPSATQREIAEALGVSLGKVNYCLRALIDEGVLKARNFRNSNKKLAYAYVLTPQGVEEKARVTLRFLKRKTEEYELLKTEIERLQYEVQRSPIE